MMMSLRYDHTTTLLSSGKVLVAGGGNDGANVRISLSEIYSIDQMVNSGVDLAEQSNPVATVSGDTGNPLFFAWQGVRAGGVNSGNSMYGAGDRGGINWSIYGQKTDNPDSGSLVNQWPSGTGGVWTLTTGSMSTKRSRGMGVVLNDGRYLLSGGLASAVDEVSTAELYDPVTGTWSLTGNMQTKRSTHGGVLLNDGKVLIYGDGSSAELYDPATNTWTVTGSMVEVRSNNSGVLLRSGKVLVAGGSSAELYDPATGTWNVTGYMDTRRSWGPLNMLSDGKVLATGGSSPTWLSTSEIYDPSTGTWTYTIGNMKERRSDFPGVNLNDGRVLVAGGYGELSGVEIYDPATGTWSVTGSLNQKRRESYLLLLNSGKVLISGGWDSISNNYTSLSEIYDPSTGTWSDTGILTNGRIRTSTALLPDGKVILAGGYNANNGAQQSIAEIYNPPDGEMLFSHDYGLAGDQVLPSIVMSEGPDPIVAWQDNRSFVVTDPADITSDWNVFMQKIDSTTGGPLWPAGRTTTGSSPYAVMDVRVDTLSGSGTHYSGKPAIGGVDSSSRMFIGWEDNRDVSGAASGECGVSNTSDLVRVCGQSYDVSEQNSVQDADWDVYFYANQAATLDVETAIAEWDGVQIGGLSNTKSWSACSPSCPSIQNVNFPSGGGDPPPSDTVGNITMRRLMVRLTWSVGSVTVSYDNTGFESRLDTGAPSSQDSIDTVPSNISDNMSAVADGSGNVHLVYIADEGTDKVGYKQRTGTTWDSEPTLVADTTNDSDAYPTLSYDATNGALYAVFIDKTTGGSNLVRYSSCTISTGCDAEGEWAAEATVTGGTGDDFTNVTANYQGVPIFAMWTVGASAPYHVDWEIILIPEKLWIFFGLAPLIPLLLKGKKKRKEYAYLQQYQSQTRRKTIHEDQSFWERYFSSKE